MPWWPSWLSDQIVFSNSECWCRLKSFKIEQWPQLHPILLAAILDIGIEWFRNSESPFYPDASHQVSSWKRRILAILNFHNTPMPPIMFKVNQTYPSVADVIWRFSRWLPWWPSWISERNHFSNSKLPCCSDALLQVSPPSHLLFGSR